jgi:PAS domain S-box-containing protein
MKKTKEQLLDELTLLRHNKAELAAVYENTPMLIILVDRERRVLRVNGVAVEFAGRPAEEMLGLRGGEALRCLNAQDDPEGCGFGPSCKLCPIQRIVLDTFKTGENHHKVEARLPFASTGGDVDLLVSTTLLRLVRDKRVLVCVEDVTERKQVEQKLLDNDLIQSDLINAVGDSLFLITPDGTTTLANEALAQRFGKTVDELVGSSTYALLSEDVATRRRGFVKTVLASGEPLSVEDERDGLYIESSLFPVRDHQGEITHICVLARDVTERKRVEEALLAEMANVDAVFESSPVGMIILDETTNIVRVNKAALTTFGVTISEVSYHRPGNALRCVNSTKDQRGCGYAAECPLCPARRGIEDLIANGGTIRGTELPLHLVRNGEPAEVWFNISAESLILNGRPHVCVAIEDITRRRGLEKHYRAFLKDNVTPVFWIEMEHPISIDLSIDDQVAAIFREGFIKDGSDQAASTWGSTRAALVGERLRVIYPPESVLPGGDVYSFYETFVRRGYKLDHYVAPETSRTGKTIWMENNTSGVVEDGCLVRIWGSFVDITERKIAESKLQESEEKFRTLFEGTNDAIGVSMNGEATFVNQAYIKLFGYNDASEITGAPLVTNIAPEERPKVLEIIRSRSSGKKAPTFYETTGIRTDGTTFDMEVRASTYQLQNKVFTMGIIRDITDRKRAEEELRKGEQQLSNAMNIAHLGPWEYDVDSDQFTFNDHFYKMFSITAEQVGGYTMSSAEYTQRFVHPDDMAIVGQEVQKAIETTDPNFNRQIEHRVIFGDGTIGHTTVRSFIAKNEQGQTIRIFGVNQDITDRKLAEEELCVSQERYALAIDGINDGIWDWDVTSNKVYFSPRWKSMIGYEDHEIAGDFSEWENLLHPDDYDRAKKSVKDYFDGKTHEYRLEHRLRHKDGSYRWILGRGMCIRDQDGKPTRMSGSHTDISDQKQAEEEREKLLHNIMERMKELQCIYGLSESIQQRDALEDIFRDAVSSIPQGWNYPKITRSRIHFDEDTYVSQPFEETQWKQSSDILAEGQKRGSVDVFYMEERPDLDEGPFLAEERKLLDSLALLLGETIDKKFAEQEKAKLEDQFHQSQKMESVGRLAGGVAHDFNNQLTAITGFSEMIAESLDPNDPLFSDIKQVLMAADSAAQLTSQLLAFSRKQTIVPKVVDINEMVDRSQKMLKRLIEEDIDLLFVPGKDLWRTKVDPGQLDQILVNLVVNARDAMPNGGKLTIETRNIELEDAICSICDKSMTGSWVTLAVSDNGCGMEPEVKDHIFEPFYTTKAKGEGTGLGLATVYGVVLQHRGHLSVYSEPGQGTSFKIYLPRVDEEVQENAIPATEAPATGTEMVLLVEDNELVRSLAKRILGKNGYRVLEAENGGSAFLKCEKYEGDIHLLLTDVVMPEMNGNELYKRIASMRPEIKVLYMSGYTDDAIAHRGVLDESTAFIQKPFKADNLLRKVRQVLDAHSPEA